MTGKQNVSDLAIFGGPPAFDNMLHVGRPNIADRSRLFSRLDQLLDSRWLTNDGPFVAEFEERLAELLEVKHCIVTCNGTVALEIAIRAAGLNGEVIVPAFTFIATAHSLQWQQITPVFCDIRPDTYNIDPSSIESLITPKTTGIIGVHLWGEPCAIEEIEEIAERHGLTVLYDAAHAFAVSHRMKMIGNFGRAEIFSFHATKFFNTFEGGAIATNDDGLAERVRLMKNFGFSGYDEVIHIGTNGKMTEVSAAMGLTGLEDLNTFIEINYRNYKQYVELLSTIPGIRARVYDENERRNYQYVVFEIDEARSGITRDSLMQVLHAENIKARRYFYPGCHLMEPYRSHFPHYRLVLKNTERVARSVLSLPTGTAVQPDDIGTVCNIVKFTVEHGAEIDRRIERSSIAERSLPSNRASAGRSADIFS